MFGQLNMTYRGNITYNQELSDIWGYAAPDGSEYAIVGVYNGVSLVEVTDPENPTELFFFPGANSTWRDIKTWGSFAYVTNETSQGVLVIDMTDLPNNATAYNWTPNISGLGTLSTCHNIWIDELGYAYLTGCNLNNGGMIYVDVSATPGVPSVAGIGPSIYNHDVFVRNNIAYSSEIYQGVFGVYDVTDKNNTILLGSAETEGNFTHNSWLSDDNSILFTTDEVANAPVGAYDVSDPTDIQELDQFRPIETLGDGVIPHNVHVWEDWLIISYYTDGCILVDGSNPSNLVEVGNFDTFIPSSTGFSGAWGAYPYLPSGLVLVSDIGNGMYVLEPNYVRACWLEGTVSDANTGIGIVGAELVIETTNVVELSGSLGSIATGYATPGSYTIQVSKGGYEPATLTVELVNGEITPLDVQLIPLESNSVSGSVVSSADGAGIPQAQIYLTNGDIDFSIIADGSGQFSFPGVFNGTYQILVGAWGFVTECEELIVNGSMSGVTLNLEQGYADDFSLDLGWTTSGTATTGDWERALPIGTQYFNNESNPGSDIDGDCSGYAYVTGNAGGESGTDDVDDGNVILQSPQFLIDLDMNPVISYYRWFANYDNTIANDLLQIYLVQGTSQILIEQLNSSSPMSDWIYHEVSAAALVGESGMYSLRVVTADDVNNGSIVEAGLDGFQIFTSVSLGENDQLQTLNVYPNPSTGIFNIDLNGLNTEGTFLVSVTDAAGRNVAELNATKSQGNLTIGEDLASGSYTLQIRSLSGNLITRPIKLIKH